MGKNHLRKQIEEVFNEYYNSMDLVGKWRLDNWMNDPINHPTGRLRVASAEHSSNYGALSDVIAELNDPVTVVNIDLDDVESVVIDIANANETILFHLEGVLEAYNDVIQGRRVLAGDITYALENLADYIAQERADIVGPYVNELKQYLIMFGNSLNVLGDVLGEKWADLTEQPIDENRDSTRYIPDEDKLHFTYMAQGKEAIEAYVTNLTNVMLDVTNLMLSEEGETLDKKRIVNGFKDLFNGMHFLTYERSLKDNIERLFKQTDDDLDTQKGQDGTRYKL